MNRKFRRTAFIIEILSLLINFFLSKKLNDPRFLNGTEVFLQEISEKSYMGLNDKWLSE